MISIIICSRKSTIPETLLANINQTIGCDFELITIDNSGNKYSIFEAYNLGIERSKGEYLCFVHDDILFHTQNWGNNLENIFATNNDYGLIGVAGSSQKTRTPSGWWDCRDEYKSINIIQHDPKRGVVKEYFGFDNSILNEVAIVDGVFLALRKEINVVFDQTLKGFHNYDFNIAIETKKKNYKIGVTNQILIEHFSIGNLNREWLQSIIQIHKKYYNSLPMTINCVLDREDEILNSKILINHCLLSRGNKKTVLKYFIKVFLKEPFSKSNTNLYKKALIYLKS